MALIEGSSALAQYLTVSLIVEVGRKYLLSILRSVPIGEFARRLARPPSMADQWFAESTLPRYSLDLDVFASPENIGSSHAQALVCGLRRQVFLHNGLPLSRERREIHCETEPESMRAARRFEAACYAPLLFGLITATRSLTASKSKYSVPLTLSQSSIQRNSGSAPISIYVR